MKSIVAVIILLIIAVVTPVEAGDYVLIVIEEPPVAPVFDLVISLDDKAEITRDLTKTDKIVYDAYLSSVTEYNKALESIQFQITGKYTGPVLNPNPPRWTKDGKVYCIYSIESRRFSQFKVLDGLISSRDTSKLMVEYPLIIVRVSSASVWLRKNGYTPANEVIIK